MDIRFCIEYFSSSAEQLHIVFSDGTSHAMHIGGNGLWSIGCKVKQSTTYHYELRNAQGEVIRKEQTAHTLARTQHKATIYDCWWDTPAEQPFYSSLFTDVVMQRKRAGKQLKPTAGTVLLEVEAPTLLGDEHLAITGGCSVLGGWDAQKAVVMNDAEAPVWKILLPREVMGSEYKFIVTDSKGDLRRYEEGNNRLIPFSHTPTTIIRGLHLRSQGEAWRGAGVAIPVFSLRSEDSWGVGEFSDLKLMSRWAKSVGMSVIQILPVNDTSASFTWRDSYPYNAISSFALHPLYIGAKAAVERCSALVDSATKDEAEALLQRYAARAKRINALKAVDYDKAITLKNKFLKNLYKICSEDVLASQSYADFLVQSKEWLLPYAAYCTLRDKYSTTDFHRWEEHSTYDATAIEKYIRRNSKRVSFYCFVQYLLDAELRDVRNYAHTLGIALKGDIPIGVSPTSVDVWCAPELYNTTMSAGAPPDAFAEDGQNWGFPTYNWAKMAEDGYDWWRRRLQKMARYFDAYRIDHILGFFRIWEVPRQAQSAIVGHFYPSKPYTAEEIKAAGIKFNAEKHCSKDLTNSDTLFVEYPEGGYTPRIEGYKCKSFLSLTQAEQEAYYHLHEEFFYHRHNDFWRECALRRLPALMATTKMLTCGEDLGMIPACVPDVMRQEGILSLEIERMPKQVGVAFGDTGSYPYLSVTATSTHDMSNIRGWWREDADLTQRYWSEVLHLEGKADKECSGKVARLIIERQMRSRSILAILPLQDWLAIDERLRLKDPEGERINIPANPNHYWQYRMHLTLEQLLTEVELNHNIKALVALR